jgi:hypothetical protein
MSPFKRVKPRLREPPCPCIVTMRRDGKQFWLSGSSNTWARWQSLRPFTFKNLKEARYALDWAAMNKDDSLPEIIKISLDSPPIRTR